MKYIGIKIVAIALLLVTTSCSEQKNGDKKIITATISPIKYLVESITDKDYIVNILVPQGASPETYEMTARQVIDIANSEFVFSFDLLDFEKGLSEKIKEGNLESYINLSSGVELIEGTCSHAECSGSHGVDPHIWTSISRLKIVSKSIHDAIIAKYPDSLKYTNNYNKLIGSLDSADVLIREMLAKDSTKHFLIYHPALGYYAEDYELTQIALERDGKEPNVNEMKEVIDLANELGLTKILFQKESRKDVVVAATKDIDGECCEINILGDNIIIDLIEVTETITNE